MAATIQDLRVELRAIQDWGRETQVFRTRIEKDALVNRLLRRMEILCALRERIVRN
jgi:hypothetical protein